MQVNQSLLTLVPLSLDMQPLDKPFVFSSFHPARGHSHNTPNPQAAIHPTLAGRRGGEKNKTKRTVVGLPNQPQAQNAGSDYIQASAESCWFQFASSSVIPCPSSRTQTCKQTDTLCCVCVCACVSAPGCGFTDAQPATSPCPRPFPNLSAPSPFSLLPLLKQLLLSTSTPSSPAASSLELFSPRRPTSSQ